MGKAAARRGATGSAMPRSTPLDVIGVGLGERVLVMQEGGAARALSKSARVPAQAVVVGVADRVDLMDGEVPEEGR